MEFDTNKEKIFIINDDIIDISEDIAIEERKDSINKRTETQNKLNKLTRATKVECFQCKICPYNTFRKPFLVKHMQQKHGFSKVKVKKRIESTYSYNDTISIEMIKNNDRAAKRPIENRNGYDDREFGCNQCNFKTTHLNLLIIHQEVHEEKEEEVYQCTQCNFKTEEVTALRDHEKTHKKLTLFSCPKCDYATRQKCNLKAHTKTHEDPEKMEKLHCPTCKKFVSFHYSALSRHIKLKHGTDGKVFKCDKCPFTAKIQKQVKNHQEQFHAADHEKAPMFKCEKCDFVTYSEQTIQKHVQRHEEREKDGEEVIVKEQGEENEIIWFCCNRCDFRSKDQRYVILHKKVHRRVDEINKVGESLIQSAEKKTESIAENS